MDVRRRAYSYVRFSSLKQARGGSFERQLRLTRAYCERLGLELDEGLTLHDLGVSAFWGANSQTGALRGFLDACKAGKVGTGSLLIVESLDRLSRDETLEALKLFRDVLREGVTIITLQPEREYLPGKTDDFSIMEALFIFSRAHEESTLKSHRAKEGWKRRKERARKEGLRMIRSCPFWVGVDEGGKFYLKEREAEVVRLVFGLCLGGVGVPAMVKELLRRGVPHPGGRGWAISSVHRMLSAPAAAGDFQPRRQEERRTERRVNGEKVVDRKKVYVPDGEVIRGYYPAAVSREDWEAARAALDGRMKNKGRVYGERGEYVFLGLVKDATTGTRMRMHGGGGWKSISGAKKKYHYLVPSGLPSVSKKSFPAALFEEATLSFLGELNLHDVLPPTTETKKEREQEKQLLNRLDGLENKLSSAKARASRAVDFESLLDIVENLEREKKEAEEELKDVRHRMECLGGAGALQEVQSLTQVLRNSTAEERKILIRRLRGMVRSLVKEVWVLVVGSEPGKAQRAMHVQVFLKSGRRKDFTIFHPRPFPLEPLGDEADLRSWRETSPASQPGQG